MGSSLFIVGLSFVHTFGFGTLHLGAITPDEVWFAGAGAAMFFTGGMNVVRVASGAGAALSWLCALAAGIMIALVVCVALAMGDFGAWQVLLQLALYGVLFLFATAQVFLGAARP